MPMSIMVLATRNSLRNMGNGGMPTMPAKQSIQSQPVAGSVLRRPRTSSMFFDLKRCRMFPEVRKNAALVREWAARCSMAAKSPAPPTPRQMAMIPMFSMDEYASIRL